MRTFFIMIVLAGCGGKNNVSIDAAIDASIDAAIDALPMLNCSAYCTDIQKNCTGTNRQYPMELDMNHCNAVCESFTVGTSTVADTSGNTLGCRIHHADFPSTMAATDCAQAGPGGDLMTATDPQQGCSGGDVCTSFCTLEIKACGSQDAPLPGNPKDDTGNPLFQYVNQGNCVNLCHSWNKMHVYSTTSTGDSLACRLSAAVMAVTNVMDGKTHCADTADFPTGMCAGAPMP